MIGIFIGIASVISLIGLGEGLRVAINSQFGFLGTDVLSVQASGGFAGPPGQGVPNPLDEDLVKKIEKINGVDVAFGRLLRTGLIQFNDEQSFGYIASVPMGENKKEIYRIANVKTSLGRLLRDSDANGILVGESYTKDTMFGRGVTTGDRLTINGKKFQVIGILERKGSFIFDNSILMNEDSMKDLFGDDGTTDIIAIKVKDVKDIAAVQADVEKLLRKERNVKKGKEDFTVQSPQSVLDSLNNTLFAVNLFVYIIAFISLIVGGIGIMNTMYTSVLERRRDIGIMKAIGAKNSTIFILFFIESGFLGLVGGLIGIILGASLAYGLAFVGRLALGASIIQASISPMLVIGSLMFSFILGTVFGTLPALQASKLQPVEALRK